MTREEMRERVARAACDAVNGDGAYDETGTLHREKVWHPVADAAIAIIRGETLEEAATMYWIHRDGKAEDIHAAIRALKEGK